MGCIAGVFIFCIWVLCCVLLTRFSEVFGWLSLPISISATACFLCTPSVRCLVCVDSMCCPDLLILLLWPSCSKSKKYTFRVPDPKYWRSKVYSGSGCTNYYQIYRVSNQMPTPSSKGQIMLEKSLSPKKCKSCFLSMVPLSLKLSHWTKVYKSKTNVSRTSFFKKIR